jgi:hypothetical protein
MIIEETIEQLKAANALCEKTASYLEATFKHIEPSMRGLLDLQDKITAAVRKLQSEAISKALVAPANPVDDE